MSFDPFADAEAIVRLTPLQQAMLAHTRLGGAGAYVGQMSARLRGSLDPAAVGEALQRLAARHAALRTCFVVDGVDEPLQVVRRAAAVPVAVEDLQGAPDAEDRLAAFAALDRERPFNLLRPPLMRVALFRLDGSAWQLVLTRHHIVMDGLSVVTLLGELEALMAGARLPPTGPFHRFIDWLDRRDGAEGELFWARALAGAGEGTAVFPGERLARGQSPAALEERVRPLGPDLVARIGASARGRGLTPQTLFAGAWALLAARYGGGEAAQFGLTVAGRPEELPDLLGAVGLFIDTLPLRVAVADHEPADAWLAALQERVAEASRHAHHGLAQIKRFAGLPADAALFSHILVLEAYGGGEAGRRDRGFSVEDYAFVDQTNFALNVGVVWGDEAHLAAVFDPTRIERPAAARLLENFAAAVEALLEAGGRPLGTIGVVSAGEERELGRFAGAGRDPGAAPGDLPARLAAAAARHAGLCALRGGGRDHSYAELWSMAGRVAGGLLREGVGCDRLVGVALPRSVAQVAAILGVLRAGGGFVPIDPDDPPARRAAMAEDAGLGIVLGPREVAALLDGPDADPPPPPPAGDAAAYALFTSGSTGRPKAALNGQAAIVNRLDWMQRAYPIGPGDRVLQKTASTFDVAVWEFLWPLLQGACLVLAPPDAHRDLEAIRAAVEAERITVLHLVPSLLRPFLALGGAERCASLRHLVASGEALDADLPGLAAAALPSAALHNLYGPAEAAIDVTSQEMHELRPGQPVPIGRPIAGATVHLLDRGGRRAPWGAIGELAIGGVAVGRGYVGRPDLTAERFAPDGLAGRPGARLYRTGDLARWDEEGRLVFHGRADHQVKIRGQRVELGEIEAALRGCPGLADAAVSVRGRGTVDAALEAFVVPSDPGEPSDRLVERLRGALRARLAPALIPTRWCALPSLPRLPSGKVDRASLARAERDPGPPRVAPRSDEEAQIAQLWAEVLGVDDVGVTDDFFERGGHSISVMRLAGLLQREFGVAVTLAELFDATSVERQLALVLDKLMAAADPELARQIMSDLGGLEAASG